MEIVTFSNRKGGCGKTTSAWSLGTGLNRKGYKVLLIDLDAQSNLTFTSGVDISESNENLYDVFCDIRDGKGTERVKEIAWEIKPGLDLICGGLELADADEEFRDNNFLLKSCLEELSPFYDYCVIDTEPHLGTLVKNALCCSDKVVIPTQADIYNLQGLNMLFGYIENVKETHNTNLKIDGILITMLNETTNHSKFMIKQIEDRAKELKIRVYETKIHSSIKASEGAMASDDIYTLFPRSRVSTDYFNFVEEFTKGKKPNKPKKIKKA